MWPFGKKVRVDEHIGLLEQRTDEYYEALAFRLAGYAGGKLELRSYSTSSYRGHYEELAQGRDDRQWINLVVGSRAAKDYSVLMPGKSCRLSDNPFKTFLERACELLGSKDATRWRGRKSAIAGCGSIPELDMRLTAAGA